MPEQSRPLSFHVIIGLCYGALLWLVGTLGWLGEPASMALCSAASVVAVVLLLLGPQHCKGGALALTSVLGAVVAGISAQVTRTVVDVLPFVAWWPAAFLLSYIVAVFILAWPTREGWRPRYEDLFGHAWGTFFILALASGLTGVFLCLMWLCAALFDVVGIGQVKQLLEHPTLLQLLLPTVFAVGMRIGLQNAHIIRHLRDTVLALCRFLLPLCAGIAVAFILVLPFTGLAPIWATGRATPMLLQLAGLLLFLLNGVVQDCSGTPIYSRAFRRWVEASLLCLPILVALAGWSSTERVLQYGLTPDRITALLLIGLMALHALAAVWAVFDRRGAWLVSLRVSNPVIALLAVALIAAYYTPLLDPLRLSARDQVQRVLDGRTAIADFDARTLYTAWGTPGREAFERLSRQVEGGTVLDAAERDQLRKRLTDARENRWNVAAEASALEWLGPLPEHADAITTLERVKQQCRSPGCYLWAVDMNDDGVQEVVVIPRERYTSSVLLYAWRESTWQQVGNFSWNGTGLKTQALIDGIRGGTLTPVTPTYKTLEVEGQTLLFQPQR